MVRLTHDVDNITSIKESSGDLVQVMELVERKREDVAVYSGMDELTVPYLSAGGAGVVSVASHVVGEEMKEMVDSFLRGNVDQAGQIQRRSRPLDRSALHDFQPGTVEICPVVDEDLRRFSPPAAVPLKPSEKDHMRFASPTDEQTVLTFNSRIPWIRLFFCNR